MLVPTLSQDSGFGVQIQCWATFFARGLWLRKVPLLCLFLQVYSLLSKPTSYLTANDTNDILDEMNTTLSHFPKQTT